jgi:chemotaxis protein CheD
MVSIEKLSLRLTQKTKGFPTHTVIGGEFAVGNDSEEIALKLFWVLVLL